MKTYQIHQLPRIAKQYAIAVIISTLAVAASAQGAEQEQLAEHALIQSNAFKKLEMTEYQKAIEAANECIQKFSPDAERIEGELRTANVPIPNPRKIVCKLKKDKEWEWTPEALEILKQGPLNDVAACYAIVGEAKEALNKARRDENLLNEAKAAYNKAALLPHALTYDGRQQPGWFWSPATKADDRLRALGNTKR